MLDKDKVIEKMSECDFTVASYSMGPNDTIKAIHFQSEPFIRRGKVLIPSFGCNIYLEEDEFEFKYIVPGSINILCTPKCSSFESMNGDHFKRIYVKFEDQVRILYRAFGGDYA